MCLADTPNDDLARRPFRISGILSSQNRRVSLANGLVDSGCSGAHTVINAAMVPRLCEELGLEPYLLPKSKPLRGFDGKLAKQPITHCLLPTLDIEGHKESTCPMLIAPLGNHDFILGKPWMNKHGVILDLLKDKLLFRPGHCYHDGNGSSMPEDLEFQAVHEPALPQTSGSVLAGQAPASAKDSAPPKPEGDMLEPLDIHEISAAAFYAGAKDKRNKLFSLTLNETPQRHDPPNPRRPRIMRNSVCPCGSRVKYKKCCGSNTKADTPAEICETALPTPQQVRDRLPEEYHDFLDVFDRSKADELPPHRSYDHKLEFVDDFDKSKLPRSRIYPMSGHKLEQVKKYLDEHLKKGFITPSKAPFASPVLFAEKPNGGLRFCVDYRRLNEITKRNRYPIPLIDEVLARVQGCKHLTRLDIIAAFNKLRMHPDSEDYTTFVTSLGSYKYRVLPFGLTNGPATYQQYMNDILFDYLNDFCQAYLDDILIYSKTKKDHVAHVRQVLQKLREAGLQVDIMKCEFHVEETRFLGLLVSIHGLRVDPDKIGAIQQWAVPVNLKQTQSFLGFCNFYRRFIRGFSKTAKPLIKLTCKDTPFQWTPACQEAFSALKTAIMTTPVLRHFDRSKEAILETDSSDFVNGGVLSQHDGDGVLHPVAFYSKNLTPAECNYQIYDKELLAIIRCLEHWRPELECTDIPVRIFTDHKGLMYFAEGRDLSRRQARYLDMLSEYNIKIVYRPGPQNIKADALTRMSGSVPTDPADARLRQQHQVLLPPERLDLDGVEVLAMDDPIFHRVADANKEDDFCTEVRTAIADGLPKHKGITLSKCSVHDGVLYHLDRLWVPESCYTELIREIHDQPACGHPGIARTYLLLKREYYWRGMRNTVTQYIQNCYSCHRAKPSRDREHGLLHPLPIPQQRWQDITIDFITGLPLSNGYNAIMTTTDRLTKERHYIPCFAGDDGTSAESTVDMLIKEIFRLHGLPASIISDRGPQFIATVWKSFCKRLGIEAKLSTAYHPQTDGQSERSNQDLERHLRTYCSHLQDDWAKWLPLTEFADNDATSAATGVTPFFSNKGFNPRMSFSPDTTDYDSTRKRLDAAKAEDITEQMQNVLAFIRQNMELAQVSMAKQTNRHRKDVTFDVGDMVFLTNKNYDTDRPSKKLDDKKWGPFEVTELIGTSYRLRLPTTMRIHDVFHASYLAKAPTNPLPGQNNPPPGPINIDKDEWEVSDILNAKLFYGHLKYRVKWTGWDDDLHWYDTCNGEFDNAQDVVDDFHLKYPHLPNKCTKPHKKTKQRRRARPQVD